MHCSMAEVILDLNGRGQAGRQRVSERTCRLLLVPILRPTLRYVYYNMYASSILQDIKTISFNI